ncbi:pheromone-processing carboxypeptidase KEX1-like [Macadamia integrifolia]|uniref:pheromone-processing carboxypeptidase KEX1-like n=1 Tax=Macadamia integrifolia TaxID=60698 RepID=UPI001C4F8C5D|nr:pheromone-processing carboxypeptidase KEX1-like [Macadamia integrifolia]
MKILSCTTSSSGCERNWSTFGLIHTKPWNRLSYEKLENLVYVHYNIKLKMKYLELEKSGEDTDVNPIDITHILNEEDSVRGWIEDTEKVLVMDKLFEDQRETTPDPIIEDLIRDINKNFKNIDDDETQAQSGILEDDDSSDDGDIRRTRSGATYSATQPDSDDDDQNKDGADDDDDDDDDSGGGQTYVLVPFIEDVAFTHAT